ncbi:ATP-dependent rRNA helicase Spb4p [Monosporozyma servazzii]
MSKNSLKWESLKYELQPWIKNAIEIMNFEHMTPVQASTIPMFAGNKDVVVDSVTGSGKTVAFVIPILEKIIHENAIQNCKKGHFHSIIISPTRELAKQIQSVINSFLEHYEPGTIKSQLLVGTNEHSIRDDVNRFIDDRPLILVGTPGRILDFIQFPNVKTQSCSMVVLDEADRLLDVSFVTDVENILNLLPKQRRTGLFSATIDSAGSNIFKTGLRNPVKIKVSSKNNQAAPSSLKLNYCVVDQEYKLQQLLHVLNKFRFKKCIVYFPTCISVTFFYGFIQYLQNHEKKDNLVNEDLHIFSLHGKLQTTSRMKTLQSFTDTLNNSVLLTTDVAARGIDIADVDLVIQLDPPNDTDLFLHRCGRTGRANRIGKALTFINRGREEDYIPFMEVKNVNLEEDSTMLNPELTIEKNKDDTFYSLFRKWILEDRDRFDHAVKSYVAFIRYYSRHSASSIFRLQSFDYIGLAKMFGLFRLPRMPEITRNLKNVDELTFGDGWIVDSKTIDMDKFQYLDEKKEKKRLHDLAELQKVHDKKKLKFELKKKNMSWSDKTETKESKAKRREKMALKRKAIEEELAKNNNSDSDNEEVTTDWKEEIMASKKRKHTESGMQGSFDDL